MLPSHSIIEKYNKTLPRYTSYPPANFFEAYSADTFYNAIVKSNDSGISNISIYIHIPFCEQLCWYCGCNTIICNSESKISDYIQVLSKEMEYVFSLLDSSRTVTQIHFGGGSPNSLSIEQLSYIVSLITQKFTLASNVEIAIECNPADIDLLYIKGLSEIGFTRVSLGIQDFNADVLNAVHRKIPKISIEDFVHAIHEYSMKVNFDFIYGLPLQTPQSFKTTIERAIEYAPERIVTFSYAHVPGVKTHQKILEKYTFANPNEKLEMLTNSYMHLSNAGYIPIGLDHFAKPDDSLSKAVQEKSLHRNFQGYCTRETTGQVYAFGVSAISQFHNAFIQNTKDLDEYKTLISTQNLAPKAGYTLNEEEIVVGSVIEYILCNNSLHWTSIAKNLSVSIEQLQNMFSWNKAMLESFVLDNLIQFHSDGFDVTETGKYFLRNIAAAFDPKLLHTDKTFSKSV